jgi:ATP-binding cassette subfamily B (MDR/TAP) protein 1
MTRKLTEQELTAYAVAGAIAEEVLSAIKTVTAFGAEERESVRYVT